VPDTWERVIFCIEVDKSTLGSADTFEGGIEAVGVTGNSETLFFKKVANRIVGFVFFIGEFGIGPDLGFVRFPYKNAVSYFHRESLQID
jgi:hypothetical protein